MDNTFIRKGGTNSIYAPSGFNTNQAFKGNAGCGRIIGRAHQLKGEDRKVIAADSFVW
jgi:hypothetical protein